MKNITLEKEENNKFYQQYFNVYFLWFSRHL